MPILQGSYGYRKEKESKPIKQFGYRKDKIGYWKSGLNSAYGGAPLVSQHSRSQVLIKEEGCVRRVEPM